MEDGVGGYSSRGVLHAPLSPTAQRRELKFLVRDDVAAKLADFCRAHLSIDPHSAAHPDGRYPVYSAYFDSDDATLLRAAINRDPVRSKLRMRCYAPLSEATDTPVYLEIKRRNNGLVRKTRASVPRYAASDLFWPREDDLAPERLNGEGGNQPLLEFLRYRHELRARPVLTLFYTREAYELFDECGVRMNFDRDICYCPVYDPGSDAFGQWHAVTMKRTVFEVKFIDPMPEWLAELIRDLGLRRRSVCKFAIAARAAAEAGLSDFNRGWLP